MIPGIEFIKNSRFILAFTGNKVYNLNRILKMANRDE
jgi:hypothetical protein